MHPLSKMSRDLSKALKPMTFAEPVTHVYNPLEYARKTHEAYLEKYGDGPKEAIFLGMNPGPFGMAQNGVPFGEIAHVRDWLGITGKVGKPPTEHPKRPVVGFACEKSEVSGRRLWGWAKERFKTPDKFFKRFFVVNYCPLVFMEGERGRNVVPEKLKKAEREPLLAACDARLKKLVEHLEPDYVIGVGTWSRKRAQKALADIEGLKFGNILHPSPANPNANRDWGPKAEKQLKELGIKL